MVMATQSDNDSCPAGVAREELAADGIPCPHCQAGEPSVWDGALFHYAHPAGSKLKVCHSPWRARCLRCSADLAQASVEFCARHGQAATSTTRCASSAVSRAAPTFHRRRSRASKRNSPTEPPSHSLSPDDGMLVALTAKQKKSPARGCSAEIDEVLRGDGGAGPTDFSSDDLKGERSASVESRLRFLPGRAGTTHYWKRAGKKV